MKKFDFDEEQLKRQLIIIGLAVALGLSLITNIVLAVSRNDQTIALIPGAMTKPWQISRYAFDKAYLADASADLAELYLETTPTTAPYRQENILLWAHPSHTQAITERLLEEAENIQKQRLTTAFSIREVATKVSGDVASARVVGQLSRFVTDKRFSQLGVVVTIDWIRDERGTARISNLTWRELEDDEATDNF